MWPQKTQPRNRPSEIQIDRAPSEQSTAESSGSYPLTNSVTKQERHKIDQNSVGRRPRLCKIHEGSRTKTQTTGLFPAEGVDDKFAKLIFAALI